MNEILFAVRLVLLLVSIYGSIQFLRQHIRLEFCFGIYFSIVGSVLFLAGILNLLRETTWVIFLAGLVLAVQSIRKKQSAREFVCPGVAFFLAFGIFFLFQLRGSIFTSYDNFSHWGLVAKILSQSHRFPNFSDQAMSFSSYPLGSTVLVYYVGEILGNSAEWVQLYAQAMVMVGMLAGLFAFARGYFQTLAAAVCAVFLLCGNNSFFELLVDSLLPIVALSGTTLCCYYGRELSKRLWVLPVYGIFLLSIKNSGALFALFLYGYAWLLLREEKLSFLTWLKLLAFPAAALLLWQKHVSLVYAHGLLAKHSMSPRYLYRMLVRKPVSQLMPIVRKMGEAVFTLSNPIFILLLFGLLLFLAARRLGKQKRPGQLLLLAAGSYVLYQIGTLGTYIFSMPLDEALRLASYGRYHKSILMFVVGLLFIQTLLTLNEAPEGKSFRLLAPAVTAAMLVLCWFAIHPKLNFFRPQEYKTSERYQFDQMVSDYQIKSGGSYVFLVREDRMDYGYLDYLLQYVLTPENYQIQRDSNLDELELENCNYVIAYEHSDKIDAFMAELSPEGASVVCFGEPEEDD